MKTYKMYDHSETSYIINNILFSHGYHLYNKIRKLTFENKLDAYIPQFNIQQACKELSTKATYNTETNTFEVCKGTKTRPKIQVMQQYFRIIPDMNHKYYEIYLGYNLKYQTTLMTVDKILKLIMMMNTLGLNLYQIDMMPSDQMIETSVSSKSIHTDETLIDICDGDLNTLSLFTDEKQINIPGITCIDGFYRFSTPYK